MKNKSKTDQSSLVYPVRLSNEKEVIDWVAEISSGNESSIRTKLRREFEQPGANVVQAFSETSLEPYVWSEGFIKFYEQTDAFIYELIIWNRNSIKRRMRSYIEQYLADHEKKGLNILCISDGLGIDSFYLAQAGHKVTYYEMPGYSHSFARKLFSLAKADINTVSGCDQIPCESFDVLICLDVLEHIPDVPAFLRQFTGYLRSGGLFFVHAPFYMIHPAHPTHLKLNRKYSGNLRLYSQNGLRLISGQFFWNPLVFAKTSDDIKPRLRSAIRILTIQLAGFYLALGRLSNLPSAD